MPNTRSPLLDDAFARLTSAASHSASSHSNPRRAPTPAQAVAGNYLKGRVKRHEWSHGLPLAIENDRNSIRRGESPDGTPWENRLAAIYGEIEGTIGADGDPIDVFIGHFPETRAVWIINQGRADGGFDEHKVMLGFQSEQAARDAYDMSFERGWTGLQSIHALDIDQLKWWLKRGDTTVAFGRHSLPLLDGATTMNKTLWTLDALPAATTLPLLMYGIRSDDREGLMLDAVTMADIYADPDVSRAPTPMLDALVVEVNKLSRKMDILLATMSAAGSAITAKEYQISDPVKLRGTMQVAVLFQLSDGQTVTLWLHNPDTTPAKLMPLDELISWKWLLNKKDITIVVAPERGKDLNVREVARRIMKLAERNMEAFKRANAKLAERVESEFRLDAEIGVLEKTLEGLHTQIEVAKERKADAARDAAKPMSQVERDAYLTSEDGYATISGDEALLLENQDLLDSFFQGRYIAVRNELRALGWTGEHFGDLSKDGVTLEPHFKQLGAGRNIVGMHYTLSGVTGFYMSDPLSRTPEELALGIDMGLPHKKPEPVVEPAPAPAESAAAPAAEPTWSDKFYSKKIDERFRVAGMNTANPISPSYPTEQESDAAAAAYFAGGEFPAPSDAAPVAVPETPAAVAPDTSHLTALMEGLSRERARLAAAATDEERAARSVKVAQIEREVAGEREFLGMPPEAALPQMSDEELMAELSAPAEEPAPAAKPTLNENLAALVDAAYLFDNATEAFKVEVSGSIEETEYSPFASAKAIDQSAKANGLKVQWSVGSAVLDSVEAPAPIADIEWPRSWLGFKVVDQAFVDARAAETLPSANSIAGAVVLALSEEGASPLYVAGKVVGVSFTASKVRYSVAVALATQPKEGVTLYAVVHEVDSELVAPLADPLPTEGATVLDSASDAAGESLVKVGAAEPVLDSAEPPAAEEEGAGKPAPEKKPEAEEPTADKPEGEAEAKDKPPAEEKKPEAEKPAAEKPAAEEKPEPKLDAVDEDAAADALLDSAAYDGMIIGKIKRGAAIIGRAMITSDGKAMIYTGKAGNNRVQYKSAIDGEKRPAMWSDDDAALMVEWLIQTIEPETDYAAEWTKMRDVDRGAMAFKAGFGSGDGTSLNAKGERIVRTGWANMGEVWRRKLIAAWNGDFAKPPASDVTPAVVALEIARETAATNEPINRAEGATDQADLEASTVAGIDAALDILAKEAAETQPEPVVEPTAIAPIVPTAPSKIEWEEAVFFAMAEQGDMSTSDAQGIADSQGVVLMQQYDAGATPEAAAAAVLAAATVPEPEPEPLAAAAPAPAEPVAAAVDSTADRAYLESLIDGTGDVFAVDVFDRLEPMFAKYETVPDMNALLEQAVEVYSAAAQKAAQDALATPA